ncbi:MAG: sugar ABC transporter permease [Oscillospiraceae bacterium]|nr:sugar ABC transporter permease [Oscillospiraceae bacterium]
MNNTRKRNFITGLLFAAPWIIGFILLQLYPMASSFYYSFTRFNIMQSPVFIGLDNYTDLLSDRLFIIAVQNTLYMLLITMPLTLACALGISLLLNINKIKGMSIYRTIFYVPTVVPPVALSVLWFFILNPRVGFINAILGFLGLPQPNWLSDPAFTKPSLILIALWTMGNVIVIYLASLKEIPSTQMEAARVDGAGSLAMLRNIILPWISPAILYTLVVNTIFYLQYFTQAYVITSASGNINDPSHFGGPMNSLNFYATYLYHTAFVSFRMGSASAMAVILLFAGGIMTFVLFKTSRKWVHYGGE